MEPLSEREKQAIRNIAEMTAMQSHLNRRTQEYLEWRRFWGADLPRPPKPWHQRVMTACRYKQERLRSRIALRIAPWLDEY